SHFRRHGAPQHRNSRPRPLSEPRTMQLVMFSRRSEVPQNGLVILRKQREPICLVLSPCADVGRGQVADIVHVEAQERAHLRLLKKILSACQSLTAQTIEVDPIFPIHCHGSISWKSHKISLLREAAGTPALPPA